MEHHHFDQCLMILNSQVGRPIDIIMIIIIIIIVVVVIIIVNTNIMLSREIKF